MGLAEKMVGLKAKGFLMGAIYDFAKKYSVLAGNWAVVTSDIIHKNVEESFSGKKRPDDNRLEDHTQKFLNWLGFSPVDLRWDAERKLMYVYIGTSRNWTADPTTDPIAGVIMKALVSALGVNFFEGKPNVDFLIDNLPPRTSYGFRMTESFGEVSPMLDNQQVPVAEAKPKTQMESASKPVQAAPSTSGAKTRAIQRISPYIEPITGSSIPKETVAKLLFDVIQEVMEEQFPDAYESVANELGSLNLLTYLFQKAEKEEMINEVGQDVGERFGQQMRGTFPDLEPHESIAGIGPKQEIEEELLFYGKASHQSDGLCKFISLIWSEYLNAFLGEQFEPDIPMCATSSSSLCLYAFTKK